MRVPYISRWSRWGVASVVAAVAVLTFVAVTVVRHATSEPTPYPLSQMGARVSFTLSDAPHVKGIVDRLTGGHRSVSGVLDRQQLVGQLTFHPTGTAAKGGGELALFVIDNRSDRPAAFADGVGPHGRHLGGGWGPGYGRLATKYRWLHALADPGASTGGHVVPESAVSFPATTRGPVTFMAALGKDSPPLTDPARDLTFVIAYVSDEGVWAQRVPASLSPAGES